MFWQKTHEVDESSAKALEQARRDLRDRKLEASRIRAITTNWRGIREQNHFAEAIKASFHGRRA